MLFLTWTSATNYEFFASYAYRYTTPLLFSLLPKSYTCPELLGLFPDKVIHLGATCNQPRRIPLSLKHPLPLLSLSGSPTIPRIRKIAATGALRIVPRCNYSSSSPSLPRNRPGSIRSPVRVTIARNDEARSAGAFWRARPGNSRLDAPAREFSAVISR